tara:strand:+ start:8240 stop:8659 length:420 start_codon:yes stop_codon:yes gene_type:complete
MVAYSGNDPRDAVMKDSITVAGVGYLLNNDGTSNKLDLTAANEIAIGVSMGESSRDADGTLETANATVSFAPLNGVMMVASAASQTYTTGLLVYVQAAGVVGTTSSSRKLLGVYVGKGEVTSSSAGELVPVNVTQAATS